jgi:hypothetical protein
MANETEDDGCPPEGRPWIPLSLDERPLAQYERAFLAEVNKPPRPPATIAELREKIKRTQKGLIEWSENRPIEDWQIHLAREWVEGLWNDARRIGVAPPPMSSPIGSLPTALAACDALLRELDRIDAPRHPADSSELPAGKRDDGGGQVDTRVDKKKMSTRGLTPAARKCAKTYTAKRRAGDKITLEAVIQDYVDDHPEAKKTSIRRSLSAHPEEWKVDTKVDKAVF